jgi:hypothetical protein
LLITCIFNPVVCNVVLVVQMDKVEREVCLVTPAFWQLLFGLSVRTLVIQESNDLMVNIKGAVDHAIVCSVLINVMRFLGTGHLFF